VTWCRQCCSPRVGLSFLAVALLAMCLLPQAIVVAEASGGTSPSTLRAVPAGAERLQCVRHGGAPQRECPSLQRRPRLYTLLEAAALPTRVLVGSTYALDGGRWLARHQMHLRVEWLAGHGKLLARTSNLTVGPAQAGQMLAVRECASVPLAVSCLTVKLPTRVTTVAEYVRASCGARRPAPPAYDANFSMIAAPQITGWDPCEIAVWAIDTYGEPPLLSAPGVTWESLIAQALGQASAATGIPFGRAPDFAAAPGSAVSSPKGVKLTIGFGPTAPGVAGTGGPGLDGGPFAIDGRVQLDSQHPWQVSEAMTVLLHEIGHALGLGHAAAEPPAPDPMTEVMDPVVTGFTTYQPGDLCGLFEATWQQPCAGAPAVTLGLGVVPAASG
jgi:hypothetical protein